MTPARKWTQPAGRAPVRAAADPSLDQLLRFIAEREVRVGAPASLLDVLKGVPHHDGVRVFQLMVQLELGAGLTYRTRNEGVQWRWRVSARGQMRLCELALEKQKGPAEVESARPVNQVSQEEQDGQKVLHGADACQHERGA